MLWAHSQQLGLKEGNDTSKFESDSAAVNSHKHTIDDVHQGQDVEEGSSRWQRSALHPSWWWWCWHDRQYIKLCSPSVPFFSHSFVIIATNTFTWTGYQAMFNAQLHQGIPTLKQVPASLGILYLAIQHVKFKDPGHAKLATIQAFITNTTTPPSMDDIHSKLVLFNNVVGLMKYITKSQSLIMEGKGNSLLDFKEIMQWLL